MERLEAWQEYVFSKVQLDGGLSVGRRIPWKAGLDQSGTWMKKRTKDCRVQCQLSGAPLPRLAPGFTAVVP